MVLGAALATATAGCAPTERYYTNKTIEPSPRAPGAEVPACGMGTPVTRLQSRSSNQRSVEGFGSFPCPAPSPGGAR